jgi:hypothetical protein
MGKLKRNGNQWEGSEGQSTVSLSNETMETLVEQEIAREERAFGELSEDEKAAARERLLNTDHYARPIPGVKITQGIRDASPPMRLRGEKA